MPGTAAKENKAAFRRQVTICGSIPKVLNIDSFDDGEMASWVGATCSAMQKHRASAATPPGGYFAPPQAACLCPLAALRTACGAGTTARPAPNERTMAQRSNEPISRTFGTSPPARCPSRGSRSSSRAGSWAGRPGRSPAAGRWSAAPAAAAGACGIRAAPGRPSSDCSPGRR